MSKKINGQDVWDDLIYYGKLVPEVADDGHFYLDLSSQSVSYRNLLTRCNLEPSFYIEGDMLHRRSDD